VANDVTFPMTITEGSLAGLDMTARLPILGTLPGIPDGKLMDPVAGRMREDRHISIRRTWPVPARPECGAC
jgi:hypothetical protein